MPDADDFAAEKQRIYAALRGDAPLHVLRTVLRYEREGSGRMTYGVPYELSVSISLANLCRDFLTYHEHPADLEE